MMAGPADWRRAFLGLWLSLMMAAVAGIIPTQADELDAGLRQAAADLEDGRIQLALDRLLALQAKSPAGDDPARAAALEGLLGQAHLAAGQVRPAREALERAQAAAARSGDAGLLAATLNDLGNLEQASGNPALAAEAFAHSQRQAQAAGRPDLAAAAALNGAGLALAQGERQRAAALLGGAQAALDRAESGAGKAMQLLTLGRRQAELGAPEDAVASYRAAETMARAAGAARLQSYALGYQAELAAVGGQPEAALALARRALFLAESAGAPEIAYLWLWRIGRLQAQAGETDQAIRTLQQAVATVGAIRSDLIVLGARQGRPVFRQTVEPLHLELADLLLRRAAAGAGPAPRQDDLGAARAVVEALRAAELEDYFQDECVAELQARARTIDRLGLRTAALYPIILPERTVLLLSLPDGLAQVPLPVPAARLTAMVREFRLLLEKRTTRQYLPAAQALYDLLLRPLEDRLQAAEIDTLVFLPDGPLRTIPLAALHDGSGFVIDRFAVATVPSLELLDPRPVGAVAINPLLNGLTQAVQGFPALPYVDEELAAIARVHGGTQLRNDQFVVPEVEESLAQTPYSVVHIASHGEFAGDPENSFLLTYNGKLGMDELEQLIKLSRFRDEPVELLTLSACRTAAGDDRAALGLAGIAIKAGARAALATLWFINDQASSLLVSAFYRELAAMPRPSKAEALRQAQLLIKADPRYRHPAYWSPFLIIGNWL
jgi:CHAT domain-containing protein